MRSVHRARGADADPFGLHRRRVSLAGALLVVAIGALLASGPATAATTPPARTPGYLFSIPTASGTVTGPDDRHLTLRLTGARNYLTRFTDRPLREAFVVANVDFARRFATYFASSPPNAVLTYTPPGARIPVSIVLTVADPRWNGRRHTWTFSATRIRKRPDTLPGTTIHITPPRIPNPRTFTSATLLIDGSSATGGAPNELAGDGIANSLSAFLATIPGVPGSNVSMTVGVEYSYPLASAAGGVTSMPVELAPDLNLDLRVQPGSPLCTVELGVIGWQDAHRPPVDGVYIFNLTLSHLTLGGPYERPFYTRTLDYPSASSPMVRLASAAC